MEDNFVEGFVIPIVESNNTEQIKTRKQRKQIFFGQRDQENSGELGGLSGGEW